MLLNSLEWVHVCVEEGQYFSEFHLAGQCKTTASITDIGKGSSLTKATQYLTTIIFFRLLCLIRKTSCSPAFRVRTECIWLYVYTKL